MNSASFGQFEELVLRAIAYLENDAYGVTIKRAVEERAMRSTSVGAIYSTLDRLEEKGFVTTRMGEPTEERGGRAKRYYKIEAAGVAALQEAEWSRQQLRPSWLGDSCPAGGGVG